MKHKLLIVDDDKLAVDAIALYLERNGFVVDVADTGDCGLAFVRQNLGKYSLAIVDFFMPEMNGATVIREIRKLEPALMILGLSGDNSVDTHNTALDAGAEAFFVKGDNLEKLYGIVRRFCDKHEEATRVVEIEPASNLKQKTIESVGLIGRSSHLVQVSALIKKFAATNDTVLIRGENGTGKERVARAIHDHSSRSSKAFIAVNMTSLTESLIESELFGHEKGAFTGANRNKIGKFQLANAGTLFLDEIGDMPLDLQAKLLRVLQEKILTPVGAEKDVKLDVRIVAATNVDLDAAVIAGKFREDLYYRLKVLPIDLLPLRDRKEDIHPLVAYFTDRYNHNKGVSKHFLEKTVNLMCNHDWRGNVRELEHEVVRLLTLNESHLVTPQELDKKYFFNNSPAVTSYPELEKSLMEAERIFIRKMLSQSKSLREAAKLMVVSKTTLIRRMRALGIEYEKSVI